MIMPTNNQQVCHCSVSSSRLLTKEGSGEVIEDRSGYVEQSEC
jgi:hypothetical protein